MSTTREALANTLAEHHLQGDTARQYDAAGQCSCGQKFYEVGGDPGSYLDAHRRLLAKHAEHEADTILSSGALDAIVAERLTALVDAWQWGGWTVITQRVKERSVLGTAQVVGDWFRSKVATIGGQP